MFDQWLGDVGCCHLTVAHYDIEERRSRDNWDEKPYLSDEVLRSIKSRRDCAAILLRYEYSDQHI